MISPQAWGWTVKLRQPLQQAHDFPTGVGVDRGEQGPAGCSERFPHRRGGGPM